MIEASKAVIEANSGKIEGVFRKGLYIFRGIPYVAPPVSGRRWLPPATADIKKGPWQAKVSKQTR